MSLDLMKDWREIRTHFNRSFSSNFFVSVASVDEENRPTNTPVGSLFLNDNQSGFYFEKYISKLEKSSKINKNICILAVNSGKIFWLKSLFKGRFDSFPGLKLYGKLGERRKATEKEINRLNRRMKMTKGMKGNTYLWGDMQYVREVVFEEVEIVNLGKMTAKL